MRPQGKYRLAGNEARGRSAGWRVLAGAALAVALAAVLPGWSAAQAQEPVAQGDMTTFQAARLSFVKGKVQVLPGDQAAFSQAMVNMPLTEGTRIETGENGEAEVEFNDGSVARLTPNSSLQLDRLAAQETGIEQLSGLGYYELNVGDGHPAYKVRFGSDFVTPQTNAIFRVDLDQAPEVSVFSGQVHAEGGSQFSADVSENQTIRFDQSASGYSVVASIGANSWDQWNQDRDQAIAAEAGDQTGVRDDYANAGSAGWNDLDYYGDWYPMPGYGNVWVPAGVGPGWDPFGYGYWGFYPSYGYLWISGYPWGWLPYHCGMWNYFSFGWGWMPGGCGMVWMPVVRIGAYPPGYAMPVRPILRNAGVLHPLPNQRLMFVNRGAEARGPWGRNVKGTVPRPGAGIPSREGNRLVLSNGDKIHPLVPRQITSSDLRQARGISPGVRTVLNGGRLPVRSTQTVGGQPGQAIRPGYAPEPVRRESRPVIREPRPVVRPAPAQPERMPRPMPPPRMSAPPPPPPPPPPSPRMSMPRGDSRGR